MLLMDGGVPPTDTPPWDTVEQPPVELDHGGFKFDFDPVASFATSHHILELSLILLLLVAVGVLLYVFTTHNVGTHNPRLATTPKLRKIWSIIGCAALVLGLSGTGWGLIDSAVSDDAGSSAATYKDFAAWASARYDVKISQHGFDDLVAGQPIAVTQFDSRVEAHALQDQDGLTYLFDNFGHELVDPQHPASGDPVGSPLPPEDVPADSTVVEP